MSSDEREQFGKRLGVTLSNKGRTRREAASLTHSTGTTIGKWVNGGAPYAVLVLAALHRELGIDLNELICGDEIENGKCKRKDT